MSTTCQAVKPNLFLYADSDAPRTNVKILKKLKNNQIKILKMFAIGSLTMDETKFILFANKRKVKSARKLNINFKNIKKHIRSLHILVVFWIKLCLGNLRP